MLNLARADWRVWLIVFAVALAGLRLAAWLSGNFLVEPW